MGNVQGVPEGQVRAQPRRRRRRRLRDNRNLANIWPRIGALRHATRYTPAQRQYAVTLMNAGISYRQAARATSPYCSS